MSTKTNYREAARRTFWDEHDRRTYTCPDCGRDASELRKPVEVHHIDGLPSNNVIENLVGLCQPCHNLREGKKPSIEGIRHLRNQVVSHADGIPGTNAVPVLSNTTEYNSHLEDCAERYLPGLNVNRIRHSPRARVEFDFILAGGWKVIDIEDGWQHGAGATLSDHAADTCQSILDKYRAEVEGWTNSTLTIEPGQTYFSTPDLPLESAARLANELAPIVKTRSNWTLTDRDLRVMDDRDCHIRLADDLEK